MIYQKRCDACMYFSVALIICELEYVDSLPSPYKRTLSKASLDRFDRPSESNIMSFDINCILKIMPKLMKIKCTETNT